MAKAARALDTIEASSSALEQRATTSWPWRRSSLDMRSSRSSGNARATRAIVHPLAGMLTGTREIASWLAIASSTRAVFERGTRSSTELPPRSEMMPFGSITRTTVADDTSTDGGPKSLFSVTAADHTSTTDDAAIERASSPRTVTTTDATRTPAGLPTEEAGTSSPTGTARVTTNPPDGISLAPRYLARNSPSLTLLTLRSSAAMRSPGVSVDRAAYTCTLLSAVDTTASTPTTDPITRTMPMAKRGSNQNDRGTRSFGRDVLRARIRRLPARDRAVRWSMVTMIAASRESYPHRRPGCGRSPIIEA